MPIIDTHTTTATPYELLDCLVGPDLAPRYLLGEAAGDLVDAVNGHLPRLWSWNLVGELTGPANETQPEIDKVDDQLRALIDWSELPEVWEILQRHHIAHSFDTAHTPDRDRVGRLTVELRTPGSHPNSNGRPLYVDPAHVVAVAGARLGTSRVYLTGGADIEVDGTAETIRRRLAQSPGGQRVERSCPAGHRLATTDHRCPRCDTLRVRYGLTADQLDQAVKVAVAGAEDVEGVLSAAHDQSSPTNPIGDVLTLWAAHH